MQNPRNPFSYRKEIGSSSSSSMIHNLIMEIGPSSSSTPRLTRDYRPGKVGRTIIDPIRNDTYLLKEEIGSSSNGCCRVYRALYSEHCMETDKLLPSGQVTLKVINKKVHENESKELQRKIDTSKGYNSFINLIGLKKTFETEELSCVSLPYMSQGSLRYILSARSEKKLPEDFIAIVLREALIGLRDELHDEFNARAHKTLNAGDIFVHINDATGEISIKLAFEASVYDSENINTEENTNEEAASSSSYLNPKSITRWGVAPEVFGRANETSGPKSDIWLLGITALELAYGELPVRNREDLDSLIKKLRRKRRFPRSLEKLLIVERKKVRFKNALDLLKRKKRVFTKKFERMVRKCLSKNPKKRPTVEQLLSSSFFTTQRDIEKFKRFVLNAENNPDPTDN